MSHERFLDLCAMYALGALDGDELREFQNHLHGGCAECEAALAEMQDAVCDLAAAAPPAQPSSDLRDRVLAAVGTTPPRRAWIGWGAAAAVVLVGRAVVWWLRGGEIQTFRLEPTPDGGADLVARVKFDPDSTATEIEFENYRAPAGKVYELWAIREGRTVPESLGVLRTDSRGELSLRLGRIGAFKALAVSLEPSGGAPAGGGPTGPVVSAGSPPSG